MTDNMKNTYRNLYSAIKADYPVETLSMFFPIEGSKYRDANSCTLSEAPRLMIVGRCVNGWNEMSNTSADNFSVDAIRAIESIGFNWLRDDGYGTDTYIRKYDGKECRYNINRSAFWRSIRNLLKFLKPDSVLDNRWFEHIVWSNLYPVAPRDEGNADDKLKQVQFEQCKKLLQQQIEFFDPTHVVFITDWDGWFDLFAEMFGISKTGDSATDNVVGIGSYNNKKLVVSIRPDRTRPNKPNETKFAEDIFKSF